MNSARRTMYVHVGVPKTGTTYLQSVFWKNRAILREEQGLTLPMRSHDDHVYAAQDLRALHDPKDYAPQSRGGLDRFVASLPTIKTPRALFSQELLAPAMPEQVDRLIALLDDFDVHIIITARDLARQIPSGWQQRVKRRAGTSYEEYLSLVLDDPDLAYPFWRNQDVAEVARRWGKPLSPDRVHIVTLPPSGAPPGTLLERFCSVVGVDPDALDSEVARDNPSLSAPQAELLRRVNMALGDRLQHRQVGYNRLGKRYFAKEVLAAQAGPSLKVPDRYAERCRQLSARIIDDIRTDGYDVVGDITDLEPTIFGESTGDAKQLLTDVTDATVAEAGVQAIATLLDQRYHDLLTIDELREKAAAGRWRARQRRRMAAVKDDPSLLLDRLPAGGTMTRAAKLAKRVGRKAHMGRG